MLGQKDGKTEKHEEVTEAFLERAKKRIDDMDFVIVLDTITESFQTFFGTSPPHENDNPFYTAKKPELTPENVQTLLELNNFDNELYEYGKVVNRRLLARGPLKQFATLQGYGKGGG